MPCSAPRPGHRHPPVIGKFVLFVLFCHLIFYRLQAKRNCASLRLINKSMPRYFLKLLKTISRGLHPRGLSPNKEHAPCSFL